MTSTIDLKEFQQSITGNSSNIQTIKQSLSGINQTISSNTSRIAALENKGSSSSTNFFSNYGVFLDEYRSGDPSFKTNSPYSISIGYNTEPIKASVCIGGSISRDFHPYAAFYSTAIGFQSTAMKPDSVSVGSCVVNNGNYSVCVGSNIDCTASGGFVIGSGGINSNDGCGVMTVMAKAEKASFPLAYFAVPQGGDEGWNIGNEGRIFDKGLELTDITITQLYLIGGGTDLAKQFTGGEAGLGFVEYNAGDIIRSGCKKLSDLLTDPFIPSLEVQGEKEHLDYTRL